MIVHVSFLRIIRSSSVEFLTDSSVELFDVRTLGRRERSACRRVECCVSTSDAARGRSSGVLAAKQCFDMSRWYVIMFI